MQHWLKSCSTTYSKRQKDSKDLKRCTKSSNKARVTNHCAKNWRSCKGKTTNSMHRWSRRKKNAPTRQRNWLLHAKLSKLKFKTTKISHNLKLAGKMLRVSRFDLQTIDAINTSKKTSLLPFRTNGWVKILGFLKTVSRLEIMRFCGCRYSHLQLAKSTPWRQATIRREQTI